MKANLGHKGCDRIEVFVAPDVANYLNNAMRASLQEMEQNSGKQIRIEADPAAVLGQHSIKFVTAGGREVSRSRS